MNDLWLAKSNICGEMSAVSCQEMKAFRRGLLHLSICHSTLQPQDRVRGMGCLEQMSCLNADSVTHYDVGRRGREKAGGRWPDRLVLL